MRFIWDLMLTAWFGYAVFLTAIQAGRVTVRTYVKLFKPARLKLEAEIVQLEKEALDSTVRWAYNQGWHRTFDEDHDMAVLEFRHYWGDDRREVR